MAAFGRVTSGGTSTRRSAAVTTRQASRQPSRSSSGENARTSSGVTSAPPSTIRTLHFLQVPWPPQVESMAMPFQLAASKSVTPGGTRTLVPAGSKYRSTRAGAAAAGSPAAVLPVNGGSLVCVTWPRLPAARGAPRSRTRPTHPG